MYTGPPHCQWIYAHHLLLPPTSSLVAGITASLDQFCFVSHSLENPSIWEWHLIRVAFLDSTALSPSCLQDGCFLVEFYTLSHEDVRFNTTNQRYWLQYHSIGTITTPTSSMTTHLIWRSDTSEALATKQNWCHFVAGLILHTQILSYMDRLTSPLSMDVIHVITSSKMIATSFLAMHCKLLILFLGLTCHLIPSMWIAVFASQSTTRCTRLLYAPCQI